jgi:putative ABC transport system ATP-binding protein
MRLLSDLVRQHGTTLIVVTHDKRIYPFADRILRLEDGLLTHTVSSLDFQLSRTGPAGLVPELRKELVA